MHWNPRISIGFVILLVIAWACSPDKERKALPERSLVSVEELQQVLPLSGAVLLLDIRDSSSYAQYHIPGAVLFEKARLVDMDNPVYGLMASETQVTQALRQIGLDSGKQVVLYDEKGNVDAARVWWVLINNGHSKVSLLDGGLICWRKRGFPLDSAWVNPQSGSFFAQRTPRFITDLQKVKNALLDSGTIILDVRSEEEYAGSSLKDGAIYPGRIPGAVRVDYLENMDWNDPASDWRFHSADHMKPIYDQIGLDSTKKVIVYCHSGVRSSLTTFYLTQIMGFKHVFNYDGSWREWSKQVENTNL